MKAAVNAVSDFVKSEMVVLMALVAAGADLAVAFGAPITPAEKGVVIVAADLVLALIARSQVTPNAAVPIPPTPPAA